MVGGCGVGSTSDWGRPWATHKRLCDAGHRRTVRGMLPHKTARGQAALERLKVFEGIPSPYDKMKRVVIPQALRLTRLRPGRKYCVLSRIAEESGWNYKDLVERLEVGRKLKAAEYYATKKVAIAAQSKAEKEVAKPQILVDSGY